MEKKKVLLFSSYLPISFSFAEFSLIIQDRAAEFW